MDLFDACDDSLIDTLTVTAEWQEGASVEAAHGALFVRGRSRFPMPFSNAAFPTDPAIDGHALLDRADAFFSDRRYVVWAHEGERNGIARAATERGFAELPSTPAMVVESPPGGTDPSNVSLTRVDDRAAFADFLRISQLAYAEAGLPAEVAASLLDHPGAAMATATIAVAHVDGVPAATALSITNAVTGVGGVYWVGTIPEMRRRGAAGAVTRFVTNAAFDAGASVVTLQASELGAPVYRRLGFREVGLYAYFLSPKGR